ncbi:unnamed protein product [Didymodactylos carnosus]|uniref:Uncharacterized protein n=1 Tax=Didymodactylos carnosus TaxID=1234261 RepID=A0A814UZG9_9BILA|nr:unnamed protein product [Didymodactylos carnosus]CAF3947306.1 unnamed protein product [Didymodactylos carnosus]
MCILNACLHVRKAEDEEEDARLCRQRSERKRRSWWDDYVVRPVQDYIVQPIEDYVIEPVQKLNKKISHGIDDVQDNPDELNENTETYVIKPVCSVLNYFGIAQAEHRRDIENTRLSSVQDLLVINQQILNNLIVNKTILTLRLEELKTKINLDKKQLHKLENELNITQFINTEMKRALLYLEKLLDVTTVLNHSTRKLYKFEFIINPLQSIYKFLYKNHLIESTFLLGTVAVPNIVNQNFKQLLKKMPYVMDNIENTNCSIQVTSTEGSIDVMKTYTRHRRSAGKKLRDLCKVP